MRSIGPYTVQRELARGGMGVVYEARDPRLDRSVALKVLSQGAGSAEDLERFVREMRVLARLTHPNIVRVHAAGTEAGRPFLALELIPGGSLHERLEREGPLPPREAVRLALGLAEALEHAHSQGVLHRDVKPRNVLLDSRGQALLTDFGLSKLLGDQDLTRTGELLGTPNYMPPEQAAGQSQRVGPAADVYGLGATLYAALTGEPPFAGRDLHQLLSAILSEAPQPPSRLRPDVPPELDAMVLRCLAKRPEERYPTASALAIALRGWLATAEREPARAGGRPGWRPRLEGLALGIALGIAGTLLLTPSFSHVVSDEAEPFYERGIDRYQRQDYAGALEDLDRLMELDPDWATVHYYRGQCLLELKRDREALPAFERARELEEDNDIEEHYALTLMRLGRLNEALAAYDRALELQPFSSKAWHDRGQVLSKQGDLEGAIACYTKALELDPRYGHAYYDRGSTRGSQGNDTAALEDYDMAITMAPKFDSAWNNRGVARSRQGDEVGAIKDYTQAIKINNEGGAAFLNRASSRFEAQDYFGCLRDAWVAVELLPTNARAHQLRAYGRMTTGDTRGALEDLLRVPGLAPGTSDAAQAFRDIRDLVRIMRERGELPGGTGGGNAPGTRRPGGAQ